MPKTRKEKYHIRNSFEIKTLLVNFAGMKIRQKMLIATPEIIDGYICNIPKGTTKDIKIMRKDLATIFHADVTCPVTTGIYTRTVAEKSYEEFQSGKDIVNITPFWRIIDPQSALAKKLSFGIDALKNLRELGG